VFVDELVRHRLCAGPDHSSGPDGFVLRKRLLGEEGARKIQVAARPRRVLAEGADIFHRALDLLRGQGIAEGRHVTVKGAYRAAAMDDGNPIGKRLDGVRRAVVEVGKPVAVGERQLKSDGALRLSAAVDAVTRGARLAVDLLA
jgi:hypothetical protein